MSEEKKELVALPDKNSRVSNMVQLIKAYETRIMALLPKHVTAERIVAVYRTAVTRTPTLLECDQFTIMAGMLEAATLGLEIGGAMHEAYLVPRYNSKRGCKEASFQVGFQGYLKLDWQTGLYDSINAAAVYENDDFDWSLGTDAYIKHRFSLTNPDRGMIVASYCIGYLKGSSRPLIRICSAAEIAQARAKAQTKNVWDEYPEPMAIKTAIHRFQKIAPKSIEIGHVVDMADAEEIGATPAYDPKILTALNGLVPQEPTSTDKLAGKLNDHVKQNGPGEDGQWDADQK